jgi:uncharacterized protein YuzE
MKVQPDIYYNEEADFLEITVPNPSEESYCEDIDEDVYVRKDEETHEIIGIGILNFKEHIGELNNILLKAPIFISFESDAIKS